MKAARHQLASLRVRLLLLVLLAIVPALGLTLYTYREQRRLETAQVQENALRLARIASADQERLIEGVRQLLVALAQLPEARDVDTAICSAVFARLLEQFPSYANLGVIGADGYGSCSGLPAGVGLFAGDRTYFLGAVESRDFAVGEHQIGRATRKASVNFGYPILDEAGQVRSVVFAALDLAWLGAYAAKAQLPPGATLIVIDRNGTILVHEPEPERWMGQSAQGSAMAEAILAGGDEGTAEVLGLDGEPRLFAFARLGGGDIYVGIGIPAKAAFADVDQSLLRNLAVLGIVAALTVAAAWLMADVFVLRPVHALVGTTKRLSAGDLSARTGLPHGHGEISQLGRAVDEMAAALERAEERRLLEEELRRKNFELEQQNLSILEANRLKTEFVSIVSHELRAPLTSIQGYVDLLLEGEGGELSGEQREFLAIARNCAKQLLTLIDQLMDLARIEAGKIELHCAQVDITDVVRRVATSMRPLIEGKGQRLTLDFADRLPAVLADADRVTQILTNLLSNASKYTPAGGHIWVAAHGADGRVFVDVRDTGIGLSAEEQAQLFTRFFRARSKAARQAGGTGLGLAITRTLVELHGGEITVSSVEGEGSTFSFSLPVAPAGEAEPVSAHALAGPGRDSQAPR